MRSVANMKQIEIGNFLWQTQKCSAIDRKGTDGKEEKTKGRKKIERKLVQERKGETERQEECSRTSIHRYPSHRRENDMKATWAFGLGQICRNC